jgi:hypothetical protein
MERDGLEVLLRPDGGSHGLVFYTGDPENLAEEIRGRGLAVDRRGNGYHLEDPDGYDIQMVDPTEDHSQPAR